MEWLNYHHLMYFWAVARSGSVKQACDQLHLAQPTISKQIKDLERSLNTKLLKRQGRSITLTEAGKAVARYADEIFSLGQQIQRAVGRGDFEVTNRVVVGITTDIPKSFAYRFLQPAFQKPHPSYIVVRDGDAAQLATDLALNVLDLIITTIPMRTSDLPRGHSHLLGETDVSVFCSESDAHTLRRGFPASLSQVPLLLPLEGTVLRHQLQNWFRKLNITPKVVGEINDTSLLKLLAQAGHAAFVAPTAMQKDIEAEYNLRSVGHIRDIRVHFYAVTVERQIANPVVARLTANAKEVLL